MREMDPRGDGSRAADEGGGACDGAPNGDVAEADSTLAARGEMALGEKGTGERLPKLKADAVDAERPDVDSADVDRPDVLLLYTCELARLADDADEKELWRMPRRGTGDPREQPLPRGVAPSRRRDSDGCDE
jgi:hypothetical protein